MRRAAAVVSLLMAITLQDAVSAQNPWHVSAPAPPDSIATEGSESTDGSRLRARGIPTYGILPLPLPKEDELRMHGDDERVPIPALGWASEYLYRVLTLIGEVR